MPACNIRNTVGTLLVTFLAALSWRDPSLGPLRSPGLGVAGSPKGHSWGWDPWCVQWGSMLVTPSMGGGHCFPSLAILVHIHQTNVSIHLADKCVLGIVHVSSSVLDAGSEMLGDLILQD